MFLTFSYVEVNVNNTVSLLLLSLGFINYELWCDKMEYIL